MEIFGYEFQNPALLEEALTTPAYRMERPEVRDNQRLEFLGDAVLGLLAADMLYLDNPKENEGALTIKRMRMVSAAALCEAAARLDLASRLKLNKGAAQLPKNSKTFADAIEAIIGAAWLDGGLAAARKVFEALSLSPNASGNLVFDNPKGTLQVKAQSMTPPRRPVYTLIKTAGKSHAPVFTVKVEVEGMGEAFAEAGSHKEAEALAAAKLLLSLGQS